MRYSKLILILLTIAAIAMFWYWNTTRSETVSVTVKTVSSGDVESTVANTRAGTVMACRRAKMSPSLGGQISALPFKEGAAVKKDDVLLELWNEDLRAEVSHATSALTAARDSSQASCLQAGNARRTADRSYKLSKSGHVSQQEYDRVRSEAEAREAECQAARANVSVARANLEIANTRLQRTILYAPFDGVIANINGELNEYVTPSPPGILTPPVIDLIEPDCFYLSAPIDEVDAPRVAIGMTARITLDSWRGRIFPARVKRIGSYIVDNEKQARTVDVEFDFTESEDLTALLVGYSADADIITETRQNVLRIPTEALLDENHVFVYLPETTSLEKRPVTKGISNWTWTEITDGLKAGDQIVSSPGDPGVSDGAVVSVTQPTND